MDSSRVDEMLKSFGFSDDSENMDVSEPESSPSQIKVSLKCSRCSLGFSQKTALYVHRLSCTRRKKVLPYCWSCGRHFPYRCLLVNHYSKCFLRHSRKKLNRKLFRKDIVDAVRTEKEHAERKEMSSKKTSVEKPQSADSIINNENDDSLSSDVQDMVSCPNCKKKFMSIQDFKVHYQDCAQRKNVNACRHCGLKLSLQQHQLHEKLCGEKIKLELLEKRRLMIQKLIESDFAESESSERAPTPKFECKCCNKTFTEAVLLRKHLAKNTSCAKVHDLKLCLERSTGSAAPLLKTARKSVVNLKGKDTDFTPDIKVKKSRVDTNNDFVNNSDDETNSDASNESYMPPVGAARKTFPSPSNKSKTKTSPFCSICFRYFPSITQLKQHEETHYTTSSNFDANSEVNKCPQCFELFNDRLSLYDHQKSYDHWGKATKSMTSTCSCPFCDKEFFLVTKRNGHLRNHVDKHSTEIVKFLESTTCNFCSETFSTESAKIQHVRIKHKEGNLTQMVLITKEPKGDRRLGRPVKDLETSTVNITYEMKRELKKHPYTCPVCFKRYSTTFIRNRHFIVHTLTNTFACQLCNTKLETADDLTQHMQAEHSNSMPYECRECVLRFATWMRALQHCSRAHPEYQVKDMIKQRNVFSDSTAEQYSKYASASMIYGSGETSSNRGGEEFYCEVCELTFLKLCGLQRHKQSKLHLQILAKSQSRKLSSQNFSVSEPEQEVARSVTPPVVNYSKNVSCSTCSITFDDLNYFVPHRLSHFSSNSGEKEVDELNPYSCEICGKVMDNQQKIQLHLFWHLQDMQSQDTPVKTAKRPITQGAMNGKAVAKKSFYKADNKANQKLVIGGVTKPLFTCDACKIGFTTKQNYVVHCRQHCQVRKQKSVGQVDDGPVKPNSSFTCSSCFVRFDTADNLRTHEKQCTTVKTRYYCQICNCIFLQSDTYEKHKSLCRAKTPANDKKDSKSTLAGCGQCSESFSSMQLLYDHVKSHHDGKIISQAKVVQMALTNDEESTNLDSEKHLLQNNESSICENDTAATTSSDSVDAAAKTVSCNNAALETGTIENSSSDPITNNNCDTNDVSDVVSIDEISAFAGIKDKDDLPEDSQEYADTIKELRENFSRLLYLLVSDPDLMQRLGYGKNPIDEVLVNVLEQMGLPTIPKSSARNELQRLRLNVRILLDVCIKDQIMELIADSQPTTDNIVLTALKMFGVDEEEGVEILALE